MNGVLLLDKPAGPTSHDAVQVVRRLARVKRAGHAGTLDPFADGLLVVMLGEATKLSGFLSGRDKVYAATVLWGAATDTLDREGRVVETSAAPLPDEPSLAAALARRVGSFQQTPPMFSAKKVDGRPLHRLARQGVEVPREARPVAVRELTLLARDAAADAFAFRVRGEKGLYVRSLADALCRDLGGCGHLISLRRERSGALDVAQATPLSRIAQLAGPAELAPLLWPLERAAAELPAVRLTPPAAEGVRVGRRPTAADAAQADRFAPGETVRLVDGAGRLLAMAAAPAEPAGPFALLRVFVQNA